MNRQLLPIVVVISLLFPEFSALLASQRNETYVLPRPAETFAGRLEPTEENSIGVWPSAVSAPEGAPNILLVLTDDVGFASVSTFGGSAPTPYLDQLAQRGLRYNQFHTTAVCSPTRASLLTGRNHHAVGSGTLADLPSPYPGYTARIPRSAATLARILRDNGYNTAMFGKDHNVPHGERSPSGPFDQWPTSRGFEYFYGFIFGDSDQWQPALYEGISRVDDRHRPSGYLLDKELADKAINWIHNQKAAAPSKPFFIYFTPGSAHAPHQVPSDWIARFRGQFDHGWDRERELILARQKAMGIVPSHTQLAPRPQQIRAWTSLTNNERKVYARYMETYAAQLAYQDAQFGRIIDELARMSIAENTLVVFIEGDNGSSAGGARDGTANHLADLSSGDFSTSGSSVDWLAENLEVLGGVHTYQNYPAGWGFATDTPFPWFKQVASHLGGTRNGLVVSWPRRIKQQGEIRSQYHHVIDIMPTLLELAGITAPASVDGIAQQPIDGVSMVYSFDDREALSARHTQYFEIHGNRAIYHQGWLANTVPRNMPWTMPTTRGSDTSTYDWELYDLGNDFSQSRNLADELPRKLEELQALFDVEARKYNVYPIQDKGGQVRGSRRPREKGTQAGVPHIVWGPNVYLPMLSGPRIFSMSFSIEAQIEVPMDGGNGVIYAAGSHFGGWSFYLDEGRPVAYASISPLPIAGMHSKVSSEVSLSPGFHRLRFDFDVIEQGGDLTIAVDGEEVGRGPIIRRPRRMAGNGETFDTGRDTNVPVSPDYQHEGVFNGEIKKVDVWVRQ